MKNFVILISSLLLLITSVHALERVTVPPGGGEQDGFVLDPVISSDGSLVVFTTTESSFSPDDNGFYDVIGWDRDSGNFELISRNAAGNGASGDKFKGGMSTDGNYVTFRASSSLQMDDTNGLDDIYVRDRMGMTTTLASRADGAMGDPANQDCYDGDVSDNGQFVVFLTRATNLVTGVTSGRSLVYLRDMVNGTTIHVSKSDAGAAASLDCFFPRISADGRYVAFTTSANNLLGAGNDTNGDPDVFIVDTQAIPNPTISRVSLSSTGQEISRGVNQMDFSKDGSKVAFTSDDDSVVPGVTPGGGNRFQVFVRDLMANTTVHASGTAAGAASESRCDDIAISPNGNYVTFSTKSNNIGVGNTEDQDDVFGFDMMTAKVSRVSVAMDGTPGNAGSFESDVSNTGDVAFVTSASNFTAGDSGSAQDIYIAPVDAPFIAPGGGNSALKAALTKKSKKIKKKLKNAKKKKKVAQVKKFKKQLKAILKKLRAL